MSYNSRPIFQFFLSLVFVLLATDAFAQPCGCVNCPKAIPDNDTIQMPINVTGAVKNNLGQQGQAVCKVCIRFDHDFVSDLEIKLVSPAGQSVTLVAPISQTGFTLSSKWGVCFVPCSQTAYPDLGKPAQWANASWGSVGTYTGSYYPYSGCLEDFNTGTVNGTWTLIVKDGDNIYDGTVLNWQIYFCDPTGLECLTCVADGGDYSKIPAVTACKGDNSLILNPIPIYTPNKPAPPITYYSYTNVITKNGVIVGFQSPVNMQNFQDGDYNVCGFSYLTADAAKLPTPNGTLTFTDLRNMTLPMNGQKSQLCGAFSKGCIPVKILASPPPTLIDSTSCKFLKIGNTTYTQSGFYTEKLKAKNGCDSLIYTNFSYIPPVKKDSFATICQGSFFQVGLKKYTKTGAYSDTLISKVTLCDSILNLFLTIKSPPINNFNQTLCEGDSVKIGTKSYKISGNYSDTLQTLKGCDSIINLDLKVNKKTFKTLKIVNCDNKNYLFNGKNYSLTGVYQDTLKKQNQFKCDSIVTIDLTIYPVYKDTFDISICQGDTYNVGNNVYDKTGFYFDILKNLKGKGTCDSLVYTRLTVSNIITKKIKEDICDGSSFFFDGKTLSLSGTYTANDKSKSGCDSITTLTLVVHANPAIGSLKQQICEGDTFKIANQKYFQTGKYTINLKSKYNCDSILNLDLTVKKIPFVLRFKTLCEGDCEKIGDSTYCKTGIYNYIFKRQNDCDSVITLNLAVNKKSVTKITPTLCEGDTVFVGKKKYFATGVYIDTLKNKGNCDSVITTNLTIIKKARTTIEKTLCFGQTITINGVIYDKKGIFKDSLKSNLTGCDSILTIKIEVLPKYYQEIKKTICTGSTFLGNDKTGVYVLSFQTQKHNCDSTIVLDLMVADSIVETYDYPICMGKNIKVGDSTYFKTGKYRNLLKSKIGCDSIVYSNLTVASCSFDYLTDVKNIGCGTNATKGTVKIKVKSDYQGFIKIEIAQFNVVLDKKQLNANEEIEVGNLDVGRVVVRLENFFGTVKYDTLEIIKLPTLKGKITKTSDFKGFGVSCPNSKDGFIKTSVTGGQAPYQFLWNKNFKDSAIYDLKAGFYQVTITDTLGCFVVLDTTLKSPPKASFYLSHSDVTCFGYNDGVIKIDSLKGGRPPYTYSVDFQSFTTNNIFKNLKPELQIISARDVFGCQIDTTQLLIEPPLIEVNLGKDTSITLGETVFIDAFTNLAPNLIEKIKWNEFVVPTCPKCLTTTVQPTFSTGYILEISDKKGCKGFDLMTVYVNDTLPIYIPNSFSPNDDGVNDFFSIQSSSKIKKIKRLSIFNRWGNMLFQADEIPTNDPITGWDGTFKNTPQPIDIYVYQVEIELWDKTVKIFKGEIALVR